MRRVLLRRAWAVAFLLAGVASVRAQPTCPATATLTLFVENLSDAPSVDVALEGALAGDATTCVGGGATSYQQTMTCTGSGTVRCGQIGGLLPGAWVHRLAVTVPGSDEQRQAQRLTVVGGSTTDVSNVLVWTVYPRAFVVRSATPEDLQARLDDATAYTLCNPGPALVTFAWDAFPGAAAPRRIPLFSASGPSPCGVPDRARCSATVAADRCPCALSGGTDGCTLSRPPDGTTAGLCVAGDRIVVDALDRDAEPGGVIFSVGTCGRQVLRLYGSDDVFRGVVFEGSRKPCQSTCVTTCKPPTCQPACAQVDTVAVTGPRARRDRLEEAVVLGPTCGDAVSVDGGAGQPDDDGAADAVIVDSRVTRGEDKGVKVTSDAHATVARSCVHDDRNGGIQSTLGGHATAIENVVQHNVPGSAQNGLSVRGKDATSTLATDGNVIRLNGGRGLSVTDNAAASFNDDYVADNQYSGSKVETTSGALAPPVARFRGVGLVCNRHEGLTGMCSPSPSDLELPCTTVDDCCLGPDDTIDPVCEMTTTCVAGSFPRGFGTVVSQAAGQSPPDASFGDAADPGRNVFQSNKNTNAGANFRVVSLTVPISAIGNQWEHCPGGPNLPCDVSQDISPPDAAVDVGIIVDPRATDEFRALRVSPPRPHAGDVVRVYGLGFDAVNGNPVAVGGTRNCADLPACLPDGTCSTGPCVGGVCPCAIDNPAVQLRNQQTNANRIRIKGRDGNPVADASGRQDFYPDAVTPTMLAFRMPFDCFAPFTLEVAKYDASKNRVVTTVPLCDRKGCTGAPAGFPCDDGNACTVDDRCDGAGTCVPGPPPPCDGPCQACDTTLGCVPKPASARCDDGSACTVGDHCSGDGNVCVGGRPVVCGGQCMTGVCDAKTGCVPQPADAPCTDGDVCTVGDHCSGTGNVCVPGAPRDCTGQCLTGACDTQRGCVVAPAGSPCDDGDACTVGDRCLGTRNTCLPGTPRVCAGDCLTGVCDPAEGCVPKAAGTVCRQATGACDVAETCDGASPDCPADAIRAAGAVCRAATGACDVAERCDGAAKDCPLDSFAPVSTACSDKNACTVGDRCAGTADLCVPGEPLACAGACLTGACDATTGCVPKTGLEAVTCRVAECSRTRLHARLEKLALLIDHAVDAGSEPRTRHVRRLLRLFARCGVAVSDPSM